MRSRTTQVHSSRSREDEQRVALRKAKIFASRGQDHLAELHINQALQLGASLQDVAAALDDLGPRHDTFNRREAIKRAVALLGAGLLSASVIDVLGPDGPALAAGPRGSPGPTGVFLTLPSDTGADGSYHVGVLGSRGVAATSGPHRGGTVVDAATAYNVAQSWGDGSASTRVTTITPTGPSASFSLPAAGRTNGATTVETATAATVRGSLLYCCHTWMRVYSGSSSKAGPDGNSSSIRFTAQPVLEVVNLEAHTLVDRWIGTEVAGACRPALKVSDDGGAALLALDMPGVDAAVPRVMTFEFDGDRLSAVSAVTPTPATRAGLASSFYHWPNPGSPVVHVALDGVHRYSPGHSADTFCALPMEYANNRRPPAFQGTFGPDGLAVASSGDGRIFHVGPRTPTTYSASKFPHQPDRPPYLTYQANTFGQVFQTAGARTWAVDNREGIGGVWQLSSGFQPGAHHLAGCYVSNMAVDATGKYLLAQSALDSMIYAIDTDGTATGFRSPPDAHLIRRS
jgi:hypothetical protein